MGKFAIGDVVLIDFPYSDLTTFKKRPALVIGMAEFDNVILCQITSSPFSSKIAIRVEINDLHTGTLPVTSYIRPDKIFTADTSIVYKRLATLSLVKYKDVKKALMHIFN